MGQLSAFDHAVEEMMHRNFLFPHEQGGPHRDRHQVNDWSMFKGGTGRGEAIQGQEEDALVLNASMTTGVIKTTLLWSEHRTQARQTMMPSATRY
jgi:hypothetical protein